MMIDLANFETTLEAAGTWPADLGRPHHRTRAGGPYPPARGRSTGAGAGAGKAGRCRTDQHHAYRGRVRDGLHRGCTAGWDAPIGVYAHSSTEIDKKWVFENVISPADYCALAAGWKSQGISLIEAAAASARPISTNCVTIWTDLRMRRLAGCAGLLVQTQLADTEPPSCH